MNLADRARHEELLVRSFVLPQRQERYLSILAKPRRRLDLLRELAHFKHIDPRWALAVPKGLGSARALSMLLQSKGAPDRCWAISEDPELDAKEIGLLEALGSIYGCGMGTFLSCLPGALAYFESEDERWILERRTKASRSQ